MTEKTAQLSDGQLQAQRAQLANQCAAAMDKAALLMKVIDDLDLEIAARRRFNAAQTRKTQAVSDCLRTRDAYQDAPPGQQKADLFARFKKLREECEVLGIDLRDM